MRTVFNPKNKEVLTFGDILGPAMEITDQADAQQYFEAYVDHIQRRLDKEPRPDDKTAAELARANLGYYAGYYGTETRIRVEELFSCAHPIFGKAASGVPTTGEAFDAGVEFAGKGDT